MRDNLNINGAFVIDFAIVAGSFNPLDFYADALFVNQKPFGPWLYNAFFSVLYVSTLSKVGNEAYKGWYTYISNYVYVKLAPGATLKPPPYHLPFPTAIKRKLSSRTSCLPS